MGKGLSPLQNDILAVLEECPGWARPRVILNRLGLEPTASNRAALSKSLARLCMRGKVSFGSAERSLPGKSNLYRLEQ
jgi:hypothetical protein